MITSPMKAIRQNCLDCAGGSHSEVTHCPVTKCPMYPFRFGKNPYLAKKVLTDERREELAKNMTAIRAKIGTTND